MYILGISGGVDTFFSNDFDTTASEGLSHDGAATLLNDGVIISAIEEERLNRIKHSNRFPLVAINKILEKEGIGIEDIDRIAVYVNEEFLKKSAFLNYLYHDKCRKLWSSNKLIADRLSSISETDISDKIVFVNHHVAHAYSAYPYSSFDESLVIVTDAMGEEKSGLIAYAEGEKINPLLELERSQSLGLFYLNVIRYLGFNMFDEFKVMGLAPYGDSKKYQLLFDEMIRFNDKGQYDIMPEHMIYETLSSIIPPRKKGHDITQEHKNISASLQVTLEKIYFHIMSYWKNYTGTKNLCMAGGVAHNCTMNGKIAASRMFDRVFVQPAAHDAGCSLGAASYAHYQVTKKITKQVLNHVYLGLPIGDENSLKETLSSWDDFLVFSECDFPSEQAAELIEKGQVIGWVQGRSEFGPRALGNRSILADPRPRENRERINAIVKKREGFRPFAISLLETKLEEYFDVDEKSADMSFMTFVVPVKEKYKKILGATTHVDGTCRVQAVSKDINRLYYDLIESFYSKTAIAGVLNTSFNNNVEPIVDSAEDAIRCFLTTDLDALFIGPFCCYKKGSLKSLLPDRCISLARVAEVSTNASQDEFRNLKKITRVSSRFDKRSVIVSDEMATILQNNVQKSLKDNICDLVDGELDKEKIISEAIFLWEQRLVDVA